MRLLVSVAFVLAGCTGFSLGENTPGGDNYVEPPPPAEGEHVLGAIAVERDEDQLWVVHQEMRAGEVRSALAAIDPVTGATDDVLDVSLATDRRVVFPSGDRMLVMAQQGGSERLVLFDTTTRTPIMETTKPTWYWGTRTAPSGRVVVVADNADPKAPLHLIDLATLRHRVLAHDGDYVEAMWNHSSDVLLALSVVDPANATPRAKLLRFDLRGHDYSQPLPAPTTLWQLDGYGWDFAFSFTWIGISPDDRWAVFPVIKHTGEGSAQTTEHVLLVLDQASGGVRLVAGRGPVGFTRDSRSIVSYGIRQTAEQSFEDLWLIDPVTLERTTLPTSYGAVSFAPMRHSDHIVAVHAFGGDTLEIHDLATQTKRTSTLPSASLGDFITRPGHVWMESSGAVSDLSLSTGTVSAIALPSNAGHINIRPSVAEAVIAASGLPEIYRVSMDTRRMIGSAIVLPSPFATARAATTATSSSTTATASATTSTSSTASTALATTAASASSAASATTAISSTASTTSTGISARRAALVPASPRLVSRAAHAGDAIVLDRR